jgi:hypothetical protein
MVLNQRVLSHFGLVKTKFFLNFENLEFQILKQLIAFSLKQNNSI